jgi:myo-inositol-1(or 4)-monophosphatase
MEVEFLKKIVKEAEGISERHFEVHRKDDEGDIVTDLDYEIEKYLIGKIKESYPDFAIVSEELNAENAETDNCFIIDPIDGTINFANGLPMWGTQVACRKNGEVVASVINLPRMGEMYYADETGAYRNGERIRVREVPVKDALYSIVGKKAITDAVKMCAYTDHRRFFGASCYDFTAMACGRIHGTNYRAEHPWDYEPGLFLCKMAGAVVKDVRGFHAAAMNQEFLDLLEKETGGR